MGQPRIPITVAIICLISAFGATVDANGDKLFPRPHKLNVAAQAPRGSVGGQRQSQAYSDLVGASYQVECRDDREGNIFGAVIQFTTATAAHWRYSNTPTWNNEELKVEYLSRERVILSVGQNDRARRAWDLQFFGGFREVRGSYRFIQDNPPPTRWRNYSLIGSKLERPARGGAVTLTSPGK
jgi:hypothetical protein